MVSLKLHFKVRDHTDIKKLLVFTFVKKQIVLFGRRKSPTRCLISRLISSQPFKSFIICPRYLNKDTKLSLQPLRASESLKVVNYLFSV